MNNFETRLKRRNQWAIGILLGVFGLLVLSVLGLLEFFVFRIFDIAADYRTGFSILILFICGVTYFLPVAISRTMTRSLDMYFAEMGTMELSALKGAIESELANNNVLQIERKVK